jgi:hypothetical protein
LVVRPTAIAIHHYVQYRSDGSRQPIAPGDGHCCVLDGIYVLLCFFRLGHRPSPGLPGISKPSRRRKLIQSFETPD